MDQLLVWAEVLALDLDGALCAEIAFVLRLAWSGYVLLRGGSVSEGLIRPQRAGSGGSPPTRAGLDTKPEYKVANALDDPMNTVIVWARLHINDVPVTWNAAGRRYNPDFVVIEEVEGKRHGWLVETKADRDMTADEVVAKRRAARKWARTVSSSSDVGGVEWHYLLLGEKDVEDAQGHWEFLKGFGK